MGDYMRKTVSNLLTGVNIVIVLLLLIASSIMIFMANTQQKGVLSYQAKLISGEKLDNKIGENCLIFVKPNDGLKLDKGSYLLHTIDGISKIIIVDEVDGNIISFNDKNGETTTLDTTTHEYGGRVTFSSNLLGGLLVNFTTKENVSLSFILIGGIFIISMLLLIILYAIHMRKMALEGDLGLGYTEDMKVFDEDEEDADYVFGQYDLPDTEDIEIHLETKTDAPNIPMETTLSPTVCEVEIDKESIASEFVDEYIHDFARAEDILAQKHNFESIFSKAVKEVATPPYYLRDDDVPSIDSLMNSIDTQFGFFNNEDKVQDEDINIFSSNK